MSNTNRTNGVEPAPLLVTHAAQPAAERRPRRRWIDLALTAVMAAAAGAAVALAATTDTTEPAPEPSACLSALDDADALLGEAWEMTLAADGYRALIQPVAAAVHDDDQATAADLAEAWQGLDDDVEAIRARVEASGYWGHRDECRGGAR